ncbi:MAG: SusD/RagB family nutrient-binding outer membrane lipoprotein [Chitinophagaceae bacterium]|nr:SusD/RagB family nutrient-binding outer membrane lipoprotein [Chitinophagaceae bacterium]
MKRIYGWLLLLLLVVMGSSCKRYLDSAYKNPNLPTYAAPEQVLQSMIANLHRGVGFDARTIGMITQNFASVVGQNQWERHGYQPGTDVGAETWRTLYWSLGYNAIDMIDSSRITGKHDYVAAAYSLLAWGWMSTADIHGELPVVQAFEKGRLAFDYDQQNVAYEYALRYTDSALRYWQLAGDLSKPTLAEGDLYFFNGNIDRWKKLVYGLKARLYHRYYLKSNYQADSVIKYADMAMVSTQDDAMIKFNLAFPDVTARNFYGPSRNNLGGFRIGAFPVNLMNGTVYTGLTDPRVKFLLRPSPDGIYRGIPAVQSADNATNQRVLSFWGVFGQTAAPAGGIDTGGRTFFKNDAKFPIMTFSEMQFLKAEAAFKKGNKTMALDAYTKGINGHFDMLTTHYTGYTPINEAEKTAYLSDTAIIPATAADLTISKIMCQKYLSLWGWGIIENWVDMRRYNYDEVNIYPTYNRLPITLLYPDNGGKLAERIRPRYNSEYLWNIEALTAVGGFAPDYHTKKVWFSLP